MQPIYPWLNDAWLSWQARLKNQTFSAATLIAAPAGVGAFQLVEPFAAALMCSAQDGEACGFCHSCDLMQSGNHPDYHVVRPEKEGRSISVEQIRHCNRLAQESSQLSGYRLIVIEPAEAMNESAANALLKTLEEPAGKCVFVLVTTRISHILPTIVSRCQQINVAEPATQMVSCWLSETLDKSVPPYAAHIHANAPLTTQVFIAEGGVADYSALESQFIAALQGDVSALINCAKAAAAQPVQRLSWLWYLLTDAQKVQFGIRQAYFTPGCEQVAGLMNFAQLQQQTDRLAKLIEQLRTFTGLNGELLITDWLLKLNEEACL
ncbi:DNA polymerase III subunit delta' [Vibrio sp. ABG19]|uniref:DNA polymerase III subunit delta' n=1 Tax=Vibrio sp. ABG19 TaxID=2817385 RepID=UPI00249EB24D|nr:DNA polymerase III subunit delta' [Vibrio sp. ABG19]WGY47450.1 DNA polymerase III subunit delta' [Vibrio sp. ABG19]